jgi:hypothetical protein
MRSAVPPVRKHPTPWGSPRLARQVGDVIGEDSAVAVSCGFEMGDRIFEEFDGVALPQVRPAPPTRPCARARDRDRVLDGSPGGDTGCVRVTACAGAAGRRLCRAGRVRGRLRRFGLRRFAEAAPGAW